MGAKALARNNINHLIWGNCFLVTLFRTPFVCHQQGSLSDMGMPPTWEKVSHLPPRTTKLSKLRDGHDSATAPTVDQIQDSLLSKKGPAVWGPPRDARMWQSLHIWGWHRYTRWTGRLSHQTSNLSHPCNALLKDCDPCLTRYWVQREKVVICLVAFR